LTALISIYIYIYIYKGNNICWLGAEISLQSSLSLFIYILFIIKFEVTLTILLDDIEHKGTKFWFVIMNSSIP